MYTHPTPRHSERSPCSEVRFLIARFLCDESLLPFSLDHELSSRAEVCAFCRPQSRDRGNPQASYARRADLSSWSFRAQSAERGIPLASRPPSKLVISSGGLRLLQTASVIPSEGLRLLQTVVEGSRQPASFKRFSASGAPQVSPARKGWETSHIEPERRRRGTSSARILWLTHARQSSEFSLYTK